MERTGHKGTQAETVVLVPYREQAETDRASQLVRLIARLEELLGARHRVVVVEQSDDGERFNRGKVLNVAYDLARQLHGSLDDVVVVLHDVDLLPRATLAPQYGLVAVQPGHALHLARSWRRYSDNPRFVGGVLALRGRDLERANGLPNTFWGWGGEDDELRRRLDDCLPPIVVDSPRPHHAREPGGVEQLEAFEDMEGLGLREKLSQLRRRGRRAMVRNKQALLAEHDETWRRNGLSAFCAKSIENDGTDGSASRGSSSASMRAYTVLGTPVQLSTCGRDRAVKYTVCLAPNGHWSDHGGRPPPRKPSQKLHSGRRPCSVSSRDGDEVYTALRYLELGCRHADESGGRRACKSDWLEMAEHVLGIGGEQQTEERDKKNNSKKKKKNKERKVPGMKPKTRVEDENGDTDGHGADDTDSGCAAPPSDLLFAHEGDTSDAAFAEWLREQIDLLPIATQFPSIARRAHAAVCRWRLRFSREVWGKFWKRQRLLKELNEYGPVIDHLERAFRSQKESQGESSAHGSSLNGCVARVPDDTPPWTIVDLCSGFGFLGMFLAELLPHDRVERIVLCDRSWPMGGQSAALPHQISWDHVRTSGWHIPLQTKKVDIKKSLQLKSLASHTLQQSRGPVAICAVHLCGTLSLRALQLFRAHPNIVSIALAPCCLPGRKHHTQSMEYAVGPYRFTAEELHTLPGGRRFNEWCEHLHRAADVPVRSKALCHVPVQQRHFQNKYIFAAKPTDTTGEIAFRSDAWSSVPFSEFGAVVVSSRCMPQDAKTRGVAARARAEAVA